MLIFYLHIRLLGNESRRGSMGVHLMWWAKAGVCLELEAAALEIQYHTPGFDVRSCQRTEIAVCDRLAW